MSDFYSILGLTKTATTAEIKAAYRRLVKIYHPDKNPNYPPAVEKFRQIQTAYDTLCDPVKRAVYDRKMSGSYTYSEYTYQSPKPKPKTKSYSFTEEDLKKRQYYKEHYKQHSTANKKRTDPAEEKKAYNEVRYILISIPLAVALLFFIINIYSKQEPETVKLPAVKSAVQKVNDTTKKETELSISTSDEPYNYYFGNGKVDKRTLQVLQVTNWSGSDAIVCVVNSKTDAVVRNYFIADRFNILYEFLPEGTYYLRTYLGKNFHSDTTLAVNNIQTLFASDQQFQEHRSDVFTIDLKAHDTIQRDVIRFKDTANKVVVDYKKFFGI